MARFEAVLLDYANTVVQFDRPQMRSIHARLAAYLSRTLAPVDSATLGAAMDLICVRPALSRDMREFTPLQQMQLVLQEAFGRPFGVDDELVADANREFQQLFVSSLELDERTLQALSLIRRRARVGLVSNYPCGASLRRSLAVLGLERHFDPVVISGEIGYVKPHPRVFEIALGLLGVAPDRVLFVGDSWSADMVGAHRAGMATCHHRGMTSTGDHERRDGSYRPDFTIDHLEQLDGLLVAAGRARLHAS
jgi:putative hydrolase of the HAD superfamily